MLDDLDALERRGLTLAVREDPMLFAACLSMAKRLIAGGRRTIALLPASTKVAVAPAAYQLAATLADASGREVAYVDANARWPLVAAETLGSLGTDTIGQYALGWARPELAVLTPHFIGDTGAGSALLRDLLEQARDRFAHLVIDLTGFRELGEHLSAARLVDGAAVVAQVGVSREDDVLDLLADLRQSVPAERCLGVILLGGSTE